MKKIAAGFMVLLAILVAGCGGGGGSSSSGGGTYISGTAAAGAPVIGYVAVRDASSNPQPVLKGIPIEANGHYSVDVSGLTAPYAFLAEGTVGGKKVSLYSAATSDDEGKTINITPFTDLIVRNIAAGAVDTYLASSANLAGLTTTELNAQRDALTAQLTPALTAMGVSGSIDLLRATFNADSTGLDRFMDTVKVDTTNPSAVTITNIMDAANQLIIDTTASTTSLATTGTLSTTNLSPSATPLDGILATGNKFSAFFATSLPNPADPNLLALFASTFILNGQSASAFLTDLTTTPTLIGMTFSSHAALQSIDTVAGVAQVSFIPIDAKGNNLSSNPGGVEVWQMKLDTVSGVWQFDGNQHIVSVNIHPYAIRVTCSPVSSVCPSWDPVNLTTPSYRTGLYLGIDNPATANIGSAIVTGNGLPAGGVTLVTQPNQNWMQITTVNSNTCTDYGMCNTNYWDMSDTEIGQVTPNSVYTVQLYDTSVPPVLLATYTETVPVAPTLNTGLSALSYPSLSGMVNLIGIGATTLHPSWSIPAGLIPDGFWVFVHDNVNNMLSQGADINTATGTASLVLTAPPSGGVWTGSIYSNYTVYARNASGGEVTTMYH